MCFRVKDLPKCICSKFSKDIDLISCCTHRATKQLSLDYHVDYVMEKGHNPNNTNNMKYAMLVRWGKGDKYIVVIGQNPSFSQTVKSYAYNVDDTNWNIIKILRLNRYDGYIMLNTFPEIDSSGDTYRATNLKKTQEDLNIKISHYIIRHLRKYKRILACTTNNNISKKYFDEIIEKYKMSVIYSNKRDKKTIEK